MKALLSLVGAVAVILSAAGCASRGPIQTKSNGGIIIPYSSAPFVGNGLTGQIICLYNTSADAQHPTSWRIRTAGSLLWGSWRAAGTPALTKNHGNYDVNFGIGPNHTSAYGNDKAPPTQFNVPIYINKQTILKIRFP